MVFFGATPARVEIPGEVYPSDPRRGDRTAGGDGHSIAGLPLAAAWKLAQVLDGNSRSESSQTPTVSHGGSLPERAIRHHPITSGKKGSTYLGTNQ